jgi:hypothetical protein
MRLCFYLQYSYITRAIRTHDEINGSNKKIDQCYKQLKAANPYVPTGLTKNFLPILRFYGGL